MGYCCYCIRKGPFSCLSSHFLSPLMDQMRLLAQTFNRGPVRNKFGRSSAPCGTCRLRREVSAQGHAGGCWRTTDPDPAVRMQLRAQPLAGSYPAGPGCPHCPNRAWVGPLTYLPGRGPGSTCPAGSTAARAKSLAGTARGPGQRGPVPRAGRASATGGLVGHPGWGNQYTAAASEPNDAAVAISRAWPKPSRKSATTSPTTIPSATIRPAATNRPTTSKPTFKPRPHAIRPS